MIVAKSCYFESNEKATMKISNGTQHRILNMQKKLLMTSMNATPQSLDEQLNEQLNERSNEQANKQLMKQSRKELKLIHR